MLDPTPTPGSWEATRQQAKALAAPLYEHLFVISVMARINRAGALNRLHDLGRGVTALRQLHHGTRHATAVTPYYQSALDAQRFALRLLQEAVEAVPHAS